MTTREAVSRFVKDGDSLITGNYNESMPTSLLYEIIRQGRKGLTYYSQSGSIDGEFMVFSGCVDKMVSAFIYKWGGSQRGGIIEQYQRAGKLQIEDYTNFTYNARLAAGAYGYSYMPVLPAIMDSDVFKYRSFMGDKKVRRHHLSLHGQDHSGRSGGQSGCVRAARAARRQDTATPSTGAAWGPPCTPVWPAGPSS